VGLFALENQMRVNLEKPAKRFEDEWKPKFQWLPRITTDGKHFVWLETVLARQWGEYEQVKISPERIA